MLFGNKKFSGIDFCDNTISCATVKVERGLPVLQKITQQEVTEEIIKGGCVADSELLIGELRDYFQKGHMSKNVHLAIPTQNILIRKVTSLPDVGESELRKLLHFHIGESIHLPFENPIYDFVKLGSIRPKQSSGKIGDMDDDVGEFSLGDLGQEEMSESPKSEVLLFATSKQLSQELADIFASAGLKALSAEIRGLALQRLLSYLHPHWLRETEMIINVAAHSVDIHIFKENLIVFSRRKSINLHEFNSETEDNDDEVFILEDELSDHLEGQRQVAATKAETRNLIEDAYLNEVFLEVERAQNFFRYSLNERDTELTRTIVTGENANRIVDPLSERMESVKVVRIDFHSILAPDFMDNDLLDSCSTAIGLAMRANEKINKH